MFLERYRRSAQAAVAWSAAPYGYTLSVWTSGAVLAHAQGFPTAWQALLFMVGAVGGFAVVGSLAIGGIRRPLPAQEERPALWRNFYFGPVAGSIGANAIVAEFLAGWPAWPVGGFVATTAYLLAVALQLTLQMDWRRLGWLEAGASRSSEVLVRRPLRRTTAYVLRREERPSGKPPLPPDA